MSVSDIKIPCCNAAQTAPQPPHSTSAPKGTLTTHYRQTDDRKILSREHHKPDWRTRAFETRDTRTNWSPEEAALLFLFFFTSFLLLSFGISLEGGTKSGGFLRCFNLPRMLCCSEACVRPKGKTLRRRKREWLLYLRDCRCTIILIFSVDLTLSYFYYSFNVVWAYSGAVWMRNHRRHIASTFLKEYKVGVSAENSHVITYVIFLQFTEMLIYLYEVHRNTKYIQMFIEKVI